MAQQTVVDTPPFWSSVVCELPYFHGILPSNDICVTFRKNGNTNGDFLIRESEIVEKNEKSLILSVYWEEPRHFIMALRSRERTSWLLPAPLRREFPTLTDLIKYYLDSGEEILYGKGLAVKLIRPVKRDENFLHNDWITLKHEIGHGEFGKVHAGVFQPPPMDVAVKVLKQSSTPNKNDKAKFIEEARKMQNFNHPNVVRLIGVAASSEPMMLVLEFCDGGSLLGYLKNIRRDHEIPRDQFCDLFRQMYRFAFEAASGMEYISKKGIIHRDLAARNCLLDKDKVLKISDFGLSRSVVNNDDEIYGHLPQQEDKFPIRWMAPETLSTDVYEFSFASDVWSYGILLWEIFTFGETPWLKYRETKKLVTAIRSGEKHPRPGIMLPQFYDDVMLKCHCFNKQNRPNFTSLRITTEQIAYPETIPTGNLRQRTASNNSAGQAIRSDYSH